MPDAKGRFQKGEHFSPQNEFKPGQHWRPHQPFREKEWLEEEYLRRGRSTGDIAKEFGVRDASILHWLRKHGIQRRSVAEARSLKHWGLQGQQNGMYGVRGSDHPNWKGGITPLRQAEYQTEAWGKVAQRIWRRDKAVCRRCKGKYAYPGQRYHVHHIVSFAIEETRVVDENLILLCAPCHWWVHSKGNRKRQFLMSFQWSLGKEANGGETLG